MAKAKTFVYRVFRTVIEEVPGHVELKLTPEEASTLLFVLGRVGGGPEGPRGLIDQIHTALSSANVLVSDSCEVYDSGDSYIWIRKNSV